MDSIQFAIRTRTCLIIFIRFPFFRNGFAVVWTRLAVGAFHSFLQKEQSYRWWKKPAPVDKSCIQVFPVFLLHLRWCRILSINSTVHGKKNPVTVEPRSFGWSTPWRLFLRCDRIETVWETKKLRHRGRVITAFISVQTMSNMQTSFDIFCILDHLGILIPWPCNLNYCILENFRMPIFSPPAAMGIDQVNFDFTSLFSRLPTEEGLPTSSQERAEPAAFKSETSCVLWWK